MDLFDAATFFDTDAVYDGYSGVYLFDAQVSSFDDSSSDGATNRRRVMSTGPTVVIPTRRVITLYGERWIVGVETPDGFGGEVIRQHFNTKRTTNLAALLTPGQALAGGAGTSAYIQKMYFKDTVNSLTDSEYDVLWNIFVAPSEPVSKGSFIRDEAGLLYRVRNTYLPTEGILLCQSDELDSDAVQSCSFATGTLDPVTEAITGGPTVATCIQVDLPKFFRFRHVSDQRAQPGDVAVFVPSSVTLKSGLTFTMLGATWRVQSFQPEIDAQVVHARRA